MYNQTLVEIYDSDDYGTLSFSKSTYNVREEDRWAQIDVTRTGGKSGHVSVDYQVSASNGANATAGTDFAASSGSLWFEPGVTRKVFKVRIYDDECAEPAGETVSLVLNNHRYSEDGYTFHAHTAGLSSAHLYIKDDESFTMGAKLITEMTGPSSSATSQQVGVTLTPAPQVGFSRIQDGCGAMATQLNSTWSIRVSLATTAHDPCLASVDADASEFQEFEIQPLIQLPGTATLQKDSPIVLFTQDLHDEVMIGQKLVFVREQNSDSLYDQLSATATATKGSNRVLTSGDLSAEIHVGQSVRFGHASAMPLYNVLRVTSSHLILGGAFAAQSATAVPIFLEPFVGEIKSFEAELPGTVCLKTGTSTISTSADLLASNLFSGHYALQSPIVSIFEGKEYTLGTVGSSTTALASDYAGSFQVATAATVVRSANAAFIATLKTPFLGVSNASFKVFRYPELQSTLTTTAGSVSMSSSTDLRDEGVRVGDMFMVKDEVMSIQGFEPDLAIDSRATVTEGTAVIGLSKRSFAKLLLKDDTVVMNHANMTRAKKAKVGAIAESIEARPGTVTLTQSSAEFNTTATVSANDKGAYVRFGDETEEYRIVDVNVAQSELACAFVEEETTSTTLLTPPAPCRPLLPVSATLPSYSPVWCHPQPSIHWNNRDDDKHLQDYQT